jgi:endonuclease YncB( thermonuclease family)
LWTKRDRYQRLVGKVLINDMDVCLEQIKRGMAWHYKEYQKEQPPTDRLSYDLAEKDARQNRVGLWADASPLAPAQFRRPNEHKN